MNKPTRSKESTSTARVRRFRETHSRIDYVPSREALEIIVAHLKAGLSLTFSGAIDSLIVHHHKNCR